MNNVLVAPSVLSADFSKLKSELDSIANADYIHYDVMMVTLFQIFHLVQIFFRTAKSLLSYPLMSI